MQHKEQISAADATIEHTTRLAYEAPELTAYNQSQITRGGGKAVTKDQTGGLGTSYKS